MLYKFQSQNINPILQISPHEFLEMERFIQLFQFLVWCKAAASCWASRRLYQSMKLTNTQRALLPSFKHCLFITNSLCPTFSFSFFTFVLLDLSTTFLWFLSCLVLTKHWLESAIDTVGRKEPISIYGWSLLLTSNWCQELF